MNFSASPNLNHLWADLMIEELVRNKAGTFCISPGSRSAPLALAVARNPKAKSLIHFDERGSAYRALGIVSATHRPCVIITTSGTAAANVFPAIIEASKKKLPLIVLTADRPPELRATGAHQTIDQNKIYGEYVRWYVDMPCPTTDIPAEFVLTTIDQAVYRATGNPGGPVHINCMYREPLAPVKTPKPSANYLKSIASWQKCDTGYTRYVRPRPQLEKSDLDEIAAKIGKIKSGIIVVGKLTGPQEQKSVLDLAEKLQWPVFPDIASGLRIGQLHKNIIYYFDQILLSEEFQRKFRPDGVVHLGGRITSKRWYEYVQEISLSQYIMVLNHPLRNDPQHRVTTRIQGNIAAVCDALTKKISKRKSNRHLILMQKLDKQVHTEIDTFLSSQANLSDPHVARLVTQMIPENSGLFMANSMPIREMDMYGMPAGKSFAIGANRGASGIDGTIAAAVGFSIGLKKPVTLFIGDLAFLYDLNSLAMLCDLAFPMVIVVLNNNGGGIFSFLPVGQFKEGFERFFGTPHHLTFNAAADLFGLNYTRPSTYEEFFRAYCLALKSQTATLIEIRTDRAYNFTIHQQLQKKIRATIKASLK